MLRLSMMQAHARSTNISLVALVVSVIYLCALPDRDISSHSLRCADLGKRRQLWAISGLSYVRNHLWHWWDVLRLVAPCGSPEACRWTMDMERPLRDTNGEKRRGPSVRFPIEQSCCRCVASAWHRRDVCVRLVFCFSVVDQCVLKCWGMIPIDYAL